jgi:hypothetical protein
MLAVTEAALAALRLPQAAWRAPAWRCAWCPANST